jgi:hypothetical protein
MHAIEKFIQRDHVTGAGIIELNGMLDPQTPGREGQRLLDKFEGQCGIPDGKGTPGLTEKHPGSPFFCHAVERGSKENQEKESNRPYYPATHMVISNTIGHLSTRRSFLRIVGQFGMIRDSFRPLIWKIHLTHEPF